MGRAEERKIRITVEERIRMAGKRRERRKRENSGENSYVEKEGGVHTRPLKLDFPRFDGAEPNNWILKAQ